MNNQTEKPAVANAKVPLWIKIMWAAGITWVLSYIVMGLKSGPTNW